MCEGTFSIIVFFDSIFPLNSAVYLTYEQSAGKLTLLLPSLSSHAFYASHGVNLLARTFSLFLALKSYNRRIYLSHRSFIISKLNACLDWGLVYWYFIFIIFIILKFVKQINLYESFANIILMFTTCTRSCLLYCYFRYFFSFFSGSESKSNNNLGTSTWYQLRLDSTPRDVLSFNLHAADKNCPQRLCQTSMQQTSF